MSGRCYSHRPQCASSFIQHACAKRQTMQHGSLSDPSLSSHLKHFQSNCGTISIFPVMTKEGSDRHCKNRNQKTENKITEAEGRKHKKHRNACQAILMFKVARYSSFTTGKTTAFAIHVHQNKPALCRSCSNSTEATLI